MNFFKKLNMLHYTSINRYKYLSFPGLCSGECKCELIFIARNGMHLSVNGSQQVNYRAPKQIPKATYVCLNFLPLN